jgi:hypothetical protein
MTLLRFWSPSSRLLSTDGWRWQDAEVNGEDRFFGTTSGRVAIMSDGRDREGPVFP